MKTKLQKVLVIVGPTAVGKSALAVKLARKLGGEVISADSRQVYKGLNIGTGKISKREMRTVPHHLLDVADPKKQFTVVEYIEKARRAIEDIARRGRLPIIVGGTGFYISALLGGENIPDVPPNKKLRAKLGKKSASELFRMLQKLDSRRAKNIDRNNSRRLIRAIEIVEALGKVPRTSTHPRYDARIIGITLPPEELRKRIAVRLSSRLGEGMIAEAKQLHAKGLSWKRMEELGLEYRYLALFLQNKITLEEMTNKLETEIWHYARRQMTWFRKDKKIQWFSAKENWRISRFASN